MVCPLERPNHFSVGSFAFFSITPLVTSGASAWGLRVPKSHILLFFLRGGLESRTFHLVRNANVLLLLYFLPLIVVCLFTSARANQASFIPNNKEPAPPPPPKT